VEVWEPWMGWAIKVCDDWCRFIVLVIGANTLPVKWRQDPS
jgi:hypothetical protein